MVVDFSGYQHYDPYPCKPNYAPDPSQLLDITGRGPHSTGTPPKWTGPVSRPPMDTFEPSGEIKLPDQFTFTAPEKIGHINMETGEITWSENTVNPGESYTVQLHRPPKPAFDPYDYRGDGLNGIRLVERDPSDGMVSKPLHGFLRQNGQTLSEAAQHVAAKGGITSEYCQKDIEKFVADTLDFFTGGQYTKEDAATLEGQVKQVVQELAQQIKDGKEMDLNKVGTKLTIAGAETTVADLFKLQKMGRLTEDTLGVHGGNLNSRQYGITGVTIAAAKKLASAHGELGKLFNQTIDRFYQQHRKELVEETQRLIDSGCWNPALFHDSVQTGLEILDAYANIDFGSASSIAQAHRNAAILVQQHDQRFSRPITNHTNAYNKPDIDRYAAWLNAQVFG